MLLTLRRLHLDEKRTVGELYVDGAFECYALEDPVRDGPKVPGQTAIPAGLYRVRLTWSPRFQRVLPLLEDVPGFEGIRIHAGNTERDTEGCPLVGQTMEDLDASDLGPEAVGRSRAALEALLLKLEAAVGGEIWIEVVNP